MYANILTTILVLSIVSLILGIIVELDKRDGTYDFFNGICVVILVFSTAFHIIRYFWV